MVITFFFFPIYNRLPIMVTGNLLQSRELVEICLVILLCRWLGSPSQDKLVHRAYGGPIMMMG